MAMLRPFKSILSWHLHWEQSVAHITSAICVGPALQSELTGTARRFRDVHEARLDFVFRWSADDLLRSFEKAIWDSLS